MSNHARGLWGYTGETPEGRPLSIQSTGMGGPSAAIVLQELAELGVRRAIRVGTCGALDPELVHGELVVAADSLAEDGASRALGAGETAEPDPGLTAALAARTSSPWTSSGSTAPQVPTRIARRTPSSASSCRTIAALGPPMPVDWMLSGRPSGVSPV